MGKAVTVIEQDGNEILLEYGPRLHVTATPLEDPKQKKRSWAVVAEEETGDPELPALEGLLATGLTRDEAAVVIDALADALLPKPVVDIPKVIERYHAEVEAVRRKIDEVVDKLAMLEASFHHEDETDFNNRARRVMDLVVDELGPRIMPGSVG